MSECNHAARWLLLLSLSMLFILTHRPASAQDSPWLGVTTGGLPLHNLYRWNGNDTLWSFDSGFVRTTNAPRSTILDAHGERLDATLDIAEIRRPIETNIWIGVGAGALLGALIDLAVITSNDPLPEGYLPGIVGFTGAGLGSLITLVYDTDEVHQLSRMNEDDRRLATQLRMPLAEPADRARTIVTIENQTPRSRRISWTSLWLQGTFGLAGVAGERFGPSAGLIVGYYNRGHNVLLDYTGWERDRDYGVVSIHYGRSWDMPTGTATLSAGPGVRWRQSLTGGRNTGTSTVPSATVRGSLFWPVNGWLGMGLSAFAGGTDSDLFGGLHLSWYLGDLD